MENMEYENIAPQPPEPLQEQPRQLPQSDPDPAAEPVLPVRRKKHRKKVAGRIALSLLLALLLIVGSCSATALALFSRISAQEKRAEQQLQLLQQELKDLSDLLNDKSFTGNGNSISGTPNTTPDGSMTPGQVYASVIDSVVAITCEIRTEVGTQVSTGISYGTGFILTEDGYIVTNYHVVEGATALTVTLHDGTPYSAMVRGYDATHDLAVLKVNARNLPAASVGSSTDLIVGDQVAVIGNPMGDLNSTLTVGFISAKDRVITKDGSLINMLQTDAAVNPGNSGGPIFNMRGEVVGIITAKYSGITNSGATIEGIGFAIPIDDVAKKIADLVEHGYVTGGYLGITCHDVNRDDALYYGLPYGVYVVSTTPGFCAEAAGMQAKDIIIALGDHVITSLNDLTRALQEFEGGEKTTVTVWRSGLEVTLDIVIDAKPHQ